MIPDVGSQAADTIKFYFRRTERTLRTACHRLSAASSQKGVLAGGRFALNEDFNGMIAVAPYLRNDKKGENL